MAALLFVLGGLFAAFSVCAVLEKIIPDHVADRIFRLLKLDWQGD